jgi:NAD+ kinase
MVRVESDMPTSIQWPFAVNEFAIQRHGANMISVETYVDGQMVATYHGDGVLLSTPTGSTAYSLSVGGPVVAPTCACLVISPLAPHNLTMRPIVIPDSCEVTFRIRARQPYAFVTLDNTAYRVREGTVFKVKKSENNFFLALPQNISFYDTLREKMMWGMDNRDDRYEEQ